nr:putative late blight resistance protein homolog R1A-10 isoform X1 [Ipomoea batatas]
MAYAAVTSLMETLSLHFLQSQPPFPLEDLEAQIGYGNQNLGLLQQILEIGNDDAGAMKDGEDEMREMGLDKASSSKGVGIKACFPRLHGIFNKQTEYYPKKKKLIKSEKLQQLADLDANEKIVSLHEKAQIRDASFKLEEMIEMELSAIYLAKDSRLHVTACLLRLHQIFNEAQKQTDYHRNELIRIQIVELLVSHLKLLRVVDMRDGIWDGAINLNVFANLAHLRFLALSTYKSTYRSNEIKLFEHWNMQSLIVSGDGVRLDSSDAYGIWKMPLLRNFCIGVIFSLETPSIVHKNLENISWLDSKLCIKDLFTMLPNLKKLGVDGGYHDSNLDWLYNVVHLGQLETLSIRRWRHLNLVMCSNPWAISLPNLKKLSLLKSNLQWSELSAISMLPNLEVLKLIDACKGPEWETCDGGFHRLKWLVIKEKNLQCWNAVGDHFPMLECLEISECYRLKEIPSGFADITTLALIQLSKCSDSLLASTMWIQEEQNNNYGNDALLVRSENIKVSFYPSDISRTI